MMRIIAFLLIILAAAAGLDWLADRPGTVVVEWQGYIAETSVLRAFIILAVALGLAVLAWSALRSLWSSPAMIGRFRTRRRHQRGLGALSSGMIAIAAGDGPLAIRYAGQARKALPHEPLTHLLRAQTAQLIGDRATSRRIFEAMLASPHTEPLGLRGLFLEAEREGEREAARQFAERALKLNPRLAWPLEALFDLQCRAADWEGALNTLAIGQRYNLIDKTVTTRRRAVLLTAQAQAAEDGAAEKALELAREAHRLAPDLVPAATIAGRVLAAQGNTPRAARVLLKTWRLSPHPDLAAAYAYARPGDSPRDRLNRMRHLARLTPHDSEGPIALAIAAIEAREWQEARAALEPLLEGRLTQRVAALMARIEGEEHGDTGRVREWLARAVNAARDPAWTADGVVSDRWEPVSPVTGALDAFRWRVPLEAIDKPAGALLSAKLEALLGFAAAGEPALKRPGAATPTAAFTANEPVLPIEEQRTPADTGPAGKPVAPMPDRAHTAPAAAARATNAPTHPEDADLKERIRPAAQRAIAASTAPTPAPQVPAAANSTRAKKPGAPPRQPQTVEPKIFVSPRAPDDPGADDPGADDRGADDPSLGPDPKSGGPDD
ncbi:MAG: heme biosynthesis protein HemY, partial [Hyphomicrobiaceae bacterium]|nr:heme biosynthesis protein HemY [Hyphomicrobiaceae bacterium]